MTKFASLMCVVVILAAGILAIARQSPPATKQPDKSIESARLNNLGVAYMNQQLFEKALKAFQQAAALDPQMRIAYMNQGIALLNLEQVDAARKFHEQAVKQNRSDPYAWYNLGMLEKNSGNSQATIASFRKVTEIDA